MLNKKASDVLKDTLKIKPPKVTKNVTVFNRTAHKSQAWIKEMQKDLKWMSGDSIYHLLKAVLQSLRDQMSVHEAAHFAAQLPLLLRGTFFEGWNPHLAQLTGYTKDEFLEAVKSKLSPIGAPNFELESGVLIALNVIKKHISAGEMEDLIGVVNPTLKTFIEKKLPQPEVSL